MGQQQLQKGIIELSLSQDWLIAKTEWSFDHLYVSEEPQECLCGKYPITNICVIKNQRNSNTVEVGNECVKRFLGMNDGIKILQSITKIKKDISKSINDITLMYLYDRNIVSNSDYKFYKDIQCKRNLTYKQLKWKTDINDKLLQYIK